MNIEYTDNYGNKWLTDDALNSKTHGEVNVRWFEEKSEIYASAYVEIKNNFQFENGKMHIYNNDIADTIKNTDYFFMLGNYTQVFVNKNTAHKNLIDAVRRLENNPFVDENLQKMYERELDEIKDDDQDFRMR